VQELISQPLPGEPWRRRTVLPFLAPCGKCSCVKKLMMLIQIQGEWWKATEKKSLSSL